MSQLTDKIILITGSLTGIGLACAELALEAGAARVILSSHHSKGAEEMLARLGPKCVFLSLDVRREEDWKAVMEHIGQRYGRLDILINNAGITGLQLPDQALGLEETTLESWQAVHRVNLDGTFLGCKHAMALMARSRGAAIVNVGSRSGLVSRTNRMAYASSKSALVNLSQSVALYAAERNYSVRCNAVLPSTILTAIYQPKGGQPPKAKDSIAHKIPLKRFGQPAEVAKAILFLASEDASYITGTTLVVDGGSSAIDALRN